jgi:hypothetical protein
MARSGGGATRGGSGHLCARSGDGLLPPP